ncbi:CPBP family intramembrane glutamic endopeptidase [Tropicimonas sp.]|uniref:CPBP family intramembrane glutamic endopeptidase n=1 Tax=Tropicimonas sp. TaxID=2067044 RepID=UPI003A847F42
MRAPEFEASLAEAKLYPQIWRLLLGFLLTIFIYVSVVVPISVGTVFAMAQGIAGDNPTTPLHLVSALGRLQNWLIGEGGANTPGAVFFLLATFLGLFFGPMLAAAAFHFRGPGSLFGPARDWARGFAIGVSVQIPFLGAAVLLGALLDPPVANLQFASWLRFLPLALPLIFVQTAAEELFFRGYLMQQLAARFAARLIWMGLPALLFALLHWDPAAGANLPVVLLYTFLFALVASDLTEQTGSLGAAMGLHFGNNVVAMLILAVSQTITGLALWVTAKPLGATGAQTLSFVVSIAVMLASWAVIRHFLTR